MIIILPSASWQVNYLCTKKEEWRRGSESNRRIKVLQTSPLPLGYRALGNKVSSPLGGLSTGRAMRSTAFKPLNWRCNLSADGLSGGISGAGDGGRTRDFDLGKVALYH